jgi:hypothetical protein
MPENTIYVGRPSKWGNPFSVMDGYSQEEAVKLFRNALTEYPLDESAILELKGKNLCCWCPLDQPCHADVLLEIANS